MDAIRVRLERELEEAGRRGDLEGGGRLTVRLVADRHWRPQSEVLALIDDCPEFLGGLWRGLLIREAPWAGLAPRRRELAARVARHVLAGQEGRSPLATSRAWSIVRLATVGLREERAAWRSAQGRRVEATFWRELDGWRGVADDRPAGWLSPATLAALGPAPSRLALDRARVAACLSGGVDVERAPSFPAALAELQRRSGAGTKATVLRPRLPLGAPGRAATVRAGQRRIVRALGLGE